MKKFTAFDLKAVYEATTQHWSSMRRLLDQGPLAAAEVLGFRPIIGLSLRILMLYIMYLRLLQCWGLVPPPMPSMFAGDLGKKVKTTCPGLDAVSLITARARSRLILISHAVEDPARHKLAFMVEQANRSDLAARRRH